MNQATHTNITKTESEYQPLFTTRDTCVGLAACMGVGLLTSLALSAIILVLSASAQAEDTASVIKANTPTEVNKTTHTALYSPEEVISQNCDTHNGELRNITVGDEMVFRNEGNHQLHFRVTGIQAVNEKPSVMPVVDDSSMLTIITCYPANNANISASYLVMIEELATVQAQRTSNRTPNI